MSTDVHLLYNMGALEMLWVWV